MQIKSWINLLIINLLLSEGGSEMYLLDYKPPFPRGGQPVKRGKLPIAFFEGEVKCKRDFLGFSMLINVSST